MWITGIYWKIQKISFATRTNIDIIVIILIVLLKVKKNSEKKIKIAVSERQLNFLLYGQSWELFQFGWLAKW